MDFNEFMRTTKLKPTIITQEQLEAMIQDSLKKGERTMQISSNGEVRELHLNSKIYPNN